MPQHGAYARTAFVAKRVYEPADPGDGYRVLIDRLPPAAARPCGALASVVINAAYWHLR